MTMSEAPRQEINLYTLDFHRQDQAFSFLFISRCCLVFFVALLVVEGITAWGLWAAQDRYAELQARQQQVKTRLTALKQSQPLSQRPKLELELNELQQQVNRREELHTIIGGQKFGNFDGFSPFLVSLARRANRDISLTNFQLLEGGNSLQLEGWARKPEAVPKYLQQLREEESLKDVRFGVLEIFKEPQYPNKLKFTLGKTGDKPT